ncbi:hypothetical protein NOVA_30135 [Nocardia nova]|uniref:Mce-associated membrane protein n=1 Tax=Nocardia nova TaxID=37330 RepID=A0A2S6A6M3_9NOCA|nr:hypothetical protein [Nocardia nova]MBV7707050.1 hypothetical protein [Nocardia nova]PPI89268.1 hypothetical protein C5E46_34275 [Nocardia nova]PPJ28224.1 hypothetical protein C5F51_15585 [Nocardia nova]
MIARTWYRMVAFLGRAARPRRARVGVLVALAVAATAFAAVGYFHYTVADQRTGDVRRDVAEQAAKLTAGVLTYKADTVDADVRQAKSHLTGQFLDSYAELATDTLIPQAKQSHIDARWEVSGTSLISAAPDSASVLVFLRGLTTNSTKPDPTYLVSTVRVQVVRPHGQWLIDRMEPL